MTISKNNPSFDIGIIGGAGHIGLPLSLILASKNFKILIHDINKKNLDLIAKGTLPFKESGAYKLLKKHKNKIYLSQEEKLLKKCKTIIVCLGTPVDEYQNPEITKFLKILSNLKKNISKSSNIIIRSSVTPGVTDYISKIFGERVAYCPERIVQGKSIEEISEIPQIVSGLSPKAINTAKKIFSKVTRKIIITSVKEAEFIKLFLNSYRYIGFALTNQFYQICEDNNLNYSNLRKKMTEDYPRAKYIPSPGFAAGPCLYKDTLQLFSVAKNNFSLGMNAIITNENFPKFIIDKCENKFNCKSKTLGILGMTFKKDIDDIRDSLSFKLLKYAEPRFKKVHFTDPYFKNIKTKKLDFVLKNSDIIIIATPHSQYDKIKITKNKFLINVWK